MRRRIFLFSALLAALSVVATAVLITLAAYSDFFDSIQEETRAEAAYLQPGVEQEGVGYLEGIEGRSGQRLTLIAADGTVVYDSVSNEKLMDNHLGRPEVQAALASGSGETTRFSNTLREQTYYYAVRLKDGSVLRIASTTASVLSSFKNVLWLVALIAAAVLILASAVASGVTRRIVKPINAIDLDHSENNAVYEELVPLLARIKDQRDQITRHIRELDRRRSEFSAITESMNEGFLVLDKDGKVLSHNKSALKLLDIQPANAAGQNVLALNRSEALRDLVQSAIGGAARESVMVLGGRSCQVFANPVIESGSVQGIVLMLMDVTEKQEREKLRREFTANVSHELKTPLTAISGYAEIIMSGMAKSEDVPEFSRSIYKEAQRLIELVRDLMFLSKLEEEAPLQKARADLLAISGAVAKRLGPKAAERKIAVSVSGQRAEVYGIPSVLEEMIYNLLDNAIKYNKEGGRAEIRVTAGEKETVVAVSDTGIGIPKAERERIFERFYRVDKSRSEAVEGTGLGLAIVKHGAMLHGAKAALKSGDGGSTFTLSFPDTTSLNE